MLEGVEQGQYCLRFPDIITTFITASLGGMAPLSLPWWCAAPVSFISVSSPCDKLFVITFISRCKYVLEKPRSPGTAVQQPQDSVVCYMTDPGDEIFLPATD